MRGVSLDEIAVATKIGTRSLKALEDENFSILPGGIFNKGFVRAYARFLGLNEDEAVADYQAAVQEQPISVKTIAAQSAMAKANRLAAQQARESQQAAGILRAAGLLVVAAAIAFGGYESYHHGYFKALKLPSLHRQMKQHASATTAPQMPRTASNPIVSTSLNAPATAIPATMAPAQQGAAAAAAPGSEPTPAEFTVLIRASAESWLSVTADGKRAIQRTLAPNEQETVTAKTRIRIVMGNPIGTELSLNGRSLAIGGDLTRPRTVVVDANGLVNPQ